MRVPAEPAAIRLEGLSFVRAPQELPRRSSAALPEQEKRPVREVECEIAGFAFCNDIAIEVKHGELLSWRAAKVSRSTLGRFAQRIIKHDGAATRKRDDAQARGGFPRAKRPAAIEGFCQRSEGGVANLRKQPLIQEANRPIVRILCLSPGWLVEGVMRVQSAEPEDLVSGTFREEERHIADEQLRLSELIRANFLVEVRVEIAGGSAYLVQPGGLVPALRSSPQV